MQTDNAVLVLNYQFALHVVKLNQYLTTEKKEYVLSKQLLRSGTSIGANLNEAQAAISKKDFIAKMSIASKEAIEIGYWLNLLADSEYIDRNSVKTQAIFTE
ncbi:four helix bundle protein [Thiosulfatimonas sediminis]|uniref:four helix bundle protein n=1 Tax=Thiosulfatimonas sediminis TaxID=2675054 RepID=UPI0018D7C627|nr:four helix bundle protein [Thiosulfatimonas sediminis]